ncbi:uncharacterized protein LOC131952307 [Physella acuta]|uniref:uncharacterized protein LOC131952307 n=1 Tax=Physella acuta TaxID=109671 RepID=UPI0027DC3689|nr:uncharacterized protein LOC131952307 [Physella acuta]
MVRRRLRERADNKTSACRNLHVLHRSRPHYLNIYVSREHRLLYCGVEKVGSSFWKRAFKVMNKPVSKRLGIFDMTSMSAHVDIPNSMKLTNYTKEEQMEMLRTFQTFMFTRDPFSHLFSAWLDKFFLPSTIAAHNIATIRRLYVGHAYRKGLVIDVHLTAIHKHCDLCNINYTLIGKMETFMQDSRSREILSLVGLEMRNISGAGARDLVRANEVKVMSDIISRTYGFLTSSPFICMPMYEGLRRLWTVFQAQGYISRHIPYPKHLHNHTHIPENEFKTAAFRAYDDSGPPEVRHQQREEAMFEAYSTVSSDTISLLETVFEPDCLMFGYSCNLTEKLIKRKFTDPVYFAGFDWQPVNGRKSTAKKDY